jgi:hypothetical protein
VTGGAEAFDDLETLPAACAELFAAGERHSFQLGRAFFRAVLAAAMAPGARGLFLLCRSKPGPGVLFPLQTLSPGARLAALTTLYSCLWQPLAAAGATPAELAAAGEAFGRFCRGWGQVRLDALDGGWWGLPPLLAGIRAAGLIPLRFDHFGNWHESVAGLTWGDYLAARPGALREVIRRRLGQADRDPATTLEVINSAAALEAGIAAYEDVYRRSWKQPEPYPRFGAALMREAAEAGVLRLGLLRLAGRPIAAQYWTVAGGTATLLKLAHDEAARARSPGSVLTAAMIRLLLQREAIAELDFGRGDDAYKALWAGERRQRIGVVLANPHRMGGLAALTRHRLGGLVARVRGLR